MWAEFTLPLLTLLGPLTRLAALGMAGSSVVQSLSDVFGHGIGGDDLGRWFDAAYGSLILDQRALWLPLLAILVIRGGAGCRLTGRSRGCDRRIPPPKPRRFA